MDLNRIAEKYSRAKVNKCAEQGCKLRAMSGSKFLILKGEIVDPHNKMCDCLVFGGDGEIVLVELKNTIQHANDILEKFRNSITASLNIVSEADLKASCVVLVLLAKKYRRPIEYNTIKRELIEGKHPIRIGQCGDLVSKFTDCDMWD